MAAIKGRAQRPHFNHTRDDTGWQERAACVDADPRIFFESARYGEALAICSTCTEKGPCGELGRGVEGVWGGRVHEPRRSSTYCPVCRQSISRTRHDRIGGHRDSAGGRCPMSGQPYRIGEGAVSA